MLSCCVCCAVLCCVCVCVCVQLLSELLLGPNNVRLMMRYVSDVQNLMQMMNMLKDTSRSIQFEAFHVFKVRRGARGGWCGGGALCVLAYMHCELASKHQNKQIGR